jgi:hypothetical protein
MAIKRAKSDSESDFSDQKEYPTTPKKSKKTAKGEEPNTPSSKGGAWTDDELKVLEELREQGTSWEYVPSLLSYFS